MAAALHHRDPDASGQSTIDNVGLAHTRLALLGLGDCGVKPIFYAQHGDRFYFASEAKAILAAGYPAETDIEIFRHHLTNQWCHGRATPFAGIFKVLPGERLEIDLETLELEHIQWCRLSDWTDSDYAAELAALPYADLVRLVEHHFQRAVRRRLLADVPVATFCSDGVDSSLVTSFAAGEQENQQAFVIQPLDDPDSDESGYAQQVYDRAGAPLNRAPFDSATWRDAFLKSIPHFENPLWIEPSMGYSIVAETITAAGFKAALGGDAADELFGGYDYRYPEERRAFAAEIGRPALDIRTEMEIVPIEPDVTKAFRHPGTAPESEREFLESTEAESRQAYAHHDGARSALESHIMAEMRLHMAIAFDQQDKATMRSSLEYREPFLDTDLVRLVVNLPLEAKIFPEIKAILRDAARPHLPEPVLTRKKLGFTYNTDHLLEERIRPSFYTNTILEQILGVKSKKVAKWFEPGRGRATFRVCSAEIWLRHFIEGESIEEIGEALWVDQ
ncbi:MAG: asparagine synthase (glutamine-hydrolyzing) [Verrucomicrobiales bacterium]|jgi:asparagine synthase (glutamine-hydrolysing)